MAVPRPGPEHKRPGGSQRALRVAGALALLLWGSLFLLPTNAQTTGDTLHYTQQRDCRIPFQLDPGERRVQQVQLFISTNQGQSWSQYANAPPNQGFFQFTAEGDGIYWFAVRTVDIDGRAYPPQINLLRPGLRVCIDTQRPVVTLDPLPPREGSVGVRWDIRDANISLPSIRLEYRLPNGAEWQPLNVEPVIAGQKYWNPGTNGLVEVRARASDLARNEAEAKTHVTLGNSDTQSPAHSAPQPGEPLVHLVNSKQIKLNYQVKDKGPSGVSVVEIWYTQDGRNWQKYRELQDEHSPFVIDVQSEGVYGFTLLARSGVGLGDRPPQAGDAPQVWVEVDLKQPEVSILNVDVSRDPDVRSLTVTWTASDKNLGRHPITLKYAERPDGEWVPFASSIENSGRYVWQIPPSVPFHKFFLKVEATDRAGNVGSATTTKEVIVDLHKPKVEIITVEPGGSTVRP